MRHSVEFRILAVTGLLIALTEQGNEQGIFVTNCDGVLARF